MSMIAVIKARLGFSPTPTNNFEIDAGAADGTLVIRRQSGQEVMKIDSLGQVTFAQMDKSLTANGYAKLPNGLIIQWGLSGATTGSVSVLFPIAFPNVCVHLNEHDQAGAITYPVTRANWQFGSLTKTGFSAANIGSITQNSAGVTPTLAPSSSSGCAWLAIGY